MATTARGLDGSVLVVRSTEQIESITLQLALFRLYIQAMAFAARMELRAASTGAARAEIVNAFRAVAA